MIDDPETEDDPVELKLNAFPLKQTAEDAPMNAICAFGFSFTFNVEVNVSVHPFKSVTVKVTNF